MPQCVFISHNLDPLVPVFLLPGCRRTRWSELLVAPPAAPQLKQDGALPRAQWRPGCGRPTQKCSLNFSESSLLVWCIVGRQGPNSTELHHRGQRRQAELDVLKQDAGLMLWSSRITGHEGENCPGNLN